MKYRFEASQGGSVAGFLVIGVILLVLTVGGVYLLQQRSEREPVSPGPVPATTSTSEKKNKPSSNNKENTTPTKESLQSSHVQKDTALPKTGPTNSIYVVLASALFAGFFVEYIQSFWQRFVQTRR